MIDPKKCGGLGSILFPPKLPDAEPRRVFTDRWRSHFFHAVVNGSFGSSIFPIVEGAVLFNDLQPLVNQDLLAGCDFAEDEKPFT